MWLRSDGLSVKPPAATQNNKQRKHQCERRIHRRHGPGSNTELKPCVWVKSYKKLFMSIHTYIKVLFINYTQWLTTVTNNTQLSQHTVMNMLWMWCLLGFWSFHLICLSGLRLGDRRKNRNLLFPQESKHQKTPGKKHSSRGEDHKEH